MQPSKTPFALFTPRLLSYRTICRAYSNALFPDT
eukprot:COSAG02_NODE_65213_length_258_cov_1.132075_1_plen_33_part_10